MTAEGGPVRAQYESWVYPQPIPDMAEAIAKHGHHDISNPSLIRRKLWPKIVEPENLDILIAGCGANQASYYALTNPACRVVGIDVSEASLRHQEFLRQKHDLKNLELYHLSLEHVSTLDRTFDLIISTGVLHHLPDPTAGLRHLRNVLRPHGVMSIMLYGYYPRVGVYMLQDAFRAIGLQQDAPGIELVKHTLKALPPWHHVSSYHSNAPDLAYDAGLVDAYLHRQDRAYTVPEVLQFVRAGQLKFQAWYDSLNYSVSFLLPRRDDPLRRSIEDLPIVDQWRMVELLGQRLGQHVFLVCHVDRPESDYALDFSGLGWWKYIPGLRQPISILTGQDFGPCKGRPSTSTVVRRGGHGVKLDALEAALLFAVDGERSIGDIIESGALSECDPAQRVEVARKFFRSMADWDHLQYEIP